MTWEIINLIGSSVIGGLMQVIGQRASAQQEQQKMLMMQNKFVEQSRDKVRKIGDANFFSMTRRIIALTCIFSIILLPMVAGIFQVPIYIQTEITTGSDWFLFSTESTQTVWKEINGMPFLEMHKNVVISIIGLYMGSSITKSK
tara:strand:+ start:371 stop:802 length:432 start_codon:yes stop_codon:yes gene_type:complete